MGMCEMKKLIGIHGKAGSGKDTLGKLIIDIALEDLKIKIERYGLADPIKKVCCYLFDWDERHANGELKDVVDSKFGFSPRHAFQTLGTNWGRACLRDDIWLFIGKDKMPEYTIITDVRFSNEAQFILDNGGLLVHIVRPSQSQISLSEHVSEAGLSPEILERAFLINNDAGFEALEAHARVIVRNFCSEKELDKTLFRSV